MAGWFCPDWHLAVKPKGFMINLHFLSNPRVQTPSFICACGSTHCLLLLLPSMGSIPSGKHLTLLTTV